MLISMMLLYVCSCCVVFQWYVKHHLVILGNASVTEGIAAVVMNNLQCGVTYNIKAEGILNETLVGSRLSHGIINPGPCPMTSSE